MNASEIVNLPKEKQGTFVVIRCDGRVISIANVKGEK